MIKKKHYSINLKIYPDLYKSQYVDYLLLTIKNWILDCQFFSTERFDLKVTQPSGLTTTYECSNSDEINFQKIFRNKFGSYIIKIVGAGRHIRGAKNTTTPPEELMDTCLSLINVKYKENSTLDGIKMLSFGKESGIPDSCELRNTDGYLWRGTNLNHVDCICNDFALSLRIGPKEHARAFNLFSSIYDMSNRTLKFNVAEEIGTFELEGVFIIQKENKEQFVKICKELECLIIRDDLIAIEEIRIDFMAISNDIFYVEKYYFDECTGTFVVKTKCY